MEKITKEQLQKLHVMLSQMGLMDEKVNMVYSISKGRVTSSKELTKDEGRLLIQTLSQSDPCEKMRKKVFALAYVAGIIYDDEPADKMINPAKLNLFLKKNGTVKKELNKMNKKELIKVVSQFEQIIKHKQQTKANKATSSLLQELNIPIEKTRQHSL